MGNVLYVRGVFTRREGTQKVSLGEQVQCVVASGVVLETSPFSLRTGNGVRRPGIANLSARTPDAHGGQRQRATVPGSRVHVVMASICFAVLQGVQFFWGVVFPGNRDEGPFLRKCTSSRDVFRDGRFGRRPGAPSEEGHVREQGICRCEGEVMVKNTASWTGKWDLLY